MTTQPALRPGAVAAAVQAWLHHNGVDGNVVTCEAMRSTVGFDNLLFLSQLAGSALPETLRAPLVLRVGQTPTRHLQAAVEAELHTHLLRHDVRVPAIHAVIAPAEPLDLPIQIMERAQGTPVLDLMLRTPWKTKRMVRQMATTLAQVHAVPLPPWADSGDLWTVTGHRLTTANEVAIGSDREGAEHVMGIVNGVLADLRDATPVLCHGDYHPANVLLGSDGLSVLDWTDAGAGDRHSDIARFSELLTVAAAVAGRTVRLALRTIGPKMSANFTESYEHAARTTLDRHRIRNWELVHLAHDWASAETAQSPQRNDRAADAIWTLLRNAALKHRDEEQDGGDKLVST